MSITEIGDNGNSEGEANDDDGTGDKGLDGLVSLKPKGGRGPEVSPD